MGMSGRRSPKVMPANRHDMSPLDSFLEQAWNDHAAELGVDHYLGKPYAEEDLLALVAHYTAAQIAG